MRSVAKPTIFILLAVILLVTVFYFMSNDNGEASASGAQSAGQAMPVETAVMNKSDVEIWKNFSGMVVAVDRAEIRPQVSGVITEIRFQDGQQVERGDVLMVIDPRPYEANLNEAKAALNTAAANANLAEKEYQRARKLIETDAIARSMLDERVSNREAAAALVKGAKAAVANAEIDLDYAHVKAPISGKISRAEITEGNLVESGSSAPLLTSIVANDQLYVDFEIDENTYLSTVQTTGAEAGQVPVLVEISGSEKDYQGYVDSFDNRIDPGSGTVRARALFNNNEQILLPGMSVQVLMGSPSRKESILVSERAIGTDQDRKFVYIIEDGQATYREIKVGESVDGQRVVLSGLNIGDEVITEGVVRIRPGMPVTPKRAMDNSEVEGG